MGKTQFFVSGYASGSGIAGHYDYGITEVYGMAQIITQLALFENLQEEIKDLYENVFLPAYNDLKKALSSFSIKWYKNSFLKISAISASATGIPMALLGFPVEQALYAGIGVSAIASIVSYNVDKRQLLRNNPYSYLFSIGREW